MSKKEVEFLFSEEKDNILQAERGISFKEIIHSIKNGGLLDVIKNTPEKYIHQEVYIVELRGYVYAVPTVKSEQAIFLKTAYPNRDLTKKYLKKIYEKNQ